MKSGYTRNTVQSFLRRFIILEAHSVQGFPAVLTSKASAIVKISQQIRRADLPDMLLRRPVAYQFGLKVFVTVTTRLGLTHIVLGCCGCFGG